MQMRKICAMNPLALNTLLPQTMRLRYQLAISVLPVGMMLLALVPSYFFAIWLEQLEGISAHTRLLDDARGRMWIAAFLIALLLQLILAYGVGWALNGLWARFIAGWPNDKVHAVFLRSELPVSWLKPAAAALSGGRASILAIARWERERKVGALAFILRKGVWAWGVPFFVFMYLIQTLLRGESLQVEAALLSAALWFSAGAFLGGVVWVLSEFNYRRMRTSLGF